MEEKVELQERPCTMRENYETKFDRKLDMLFEKMLDIESMLRCQRIEKEEKDIKKQKQELEYHTQDLEYRKINAYEYDRKQKEAFRKGYWD